MSALRTAIVAIALCVSFVTVAASEVTAPAKERKTNRLLDAPSPYLRQHAYNPVDWYPWGEEAFAKARAENKPILLSVGYATCHWCHVMERESYSDPKIADILNTGFIAIKVDRERRPEIDEVYILATQLLTQQSGGWPNNVILTPDLMPFFGGTYFPRNAFEDLLRQVIVEWTVNNGAIQAEARRVAGLIDQVMKHRTAATDLTPSVMKSALATAIADFDTKYGGIGTDAKFPRESLLLFLLDHAEKTGDADALAVVTKTLDAMVRGGIHDHVGGGFHRYTVDRTWVVPHFEKMLYNQAGIARVLLQAHRLNSDRGYDIAARRLFDFVLRDMAAEAGGFYSAFDADSTGGGNEKEEGLFYVWTPDELNTALGADDAAVAMKTFGVTPEGNFEGRSVLHFPQSVATNKLVTQELRSIYDRLRAYREANRKAPYRDNKVLTAWNGAMITALAEGAQALSEPRYLDAAVATGAFFWDKMGGASGKLMRQYYEGTASLDATQQGYALLALGFISLYDATGDGLWLDRAKALADTMNTRFLDKDANDYFMTPENSGFYRPKISADGDLPAGNAAAVDLFARLSRRDLDPEHRVTAEAIMAAISGNAVTQPASYAYSLRAIDQLLRGETGRKQYVARGRVSAVAGRNADRAEVTVSMDVAEGWHINAHKPLEDTFIPTVIETANGQPVQIDYPKPLIRKLGFHDTDLALYEGKVRFKVSGKAGQPAPKKLTLTLQACSTKICLEPETVTLPVVIN